MFFLVPFQVEQNLERAAHKLCFLRGTKLISAESPIKMNGNAIDGKSPFYEMKSIPEQGNVLETEPSFDDAAGCPFESFYRANRNEKQLDYQYRCAYLPILRICCTFGGKRYPKPSANRFHGSSHGSSLNGHERLRFSHARSGRAEPRPLFLRCKRNAENTPVRNFRGTAKAGRRDSRDSDSMAEPSADGGLKARETGQVCLQTRG